MFQFTAGTTYPFFGNQVPVPAVTDRYIAAPPSTTIPTGATKAGTAPAPNTAVSVPPPSTAATK